jgi:eukaryotic-like serine/threonine-protein kinase
VASPRTLIGRPAFADTGETAPTRRGGRILPRRPVPARVASSLDGELLAGRYRLCERLGSGGFGVVWAGYDEQLRREVAVKRIPLGPDGDAARAAREAQAAARLSHPAIVALFEAFADEDAFHLISELVRGSTLARLIATGELDDAHTIEIGIALAEALAHAHERGVVHRDIKPQNVLVPELEQGPRGERVGRRAAAKLTDFGGAALAGEEALTRTGDVLGTLAYMAPEQSEGDEVTEQADLYALALVLYEALSAVNPVRRGTAAATVRQIGQPIESLRRLRPELPRELTGAIDHALLAHPEDRGELADLLSALRESREHEPCVPTRRLRPRRRDVPLLEQRHEAVREERAGPLPPSALEPASGPRVPALPRLVLLALALLVAGWQAAAGHPGLALLLAAALLPLQLYPAAYGSRRPSLAWAAAVLAPLLGTVGLAGAFPALAGQARRWHERAALGALGYWWLTLAEPLLARRLWLGPPAGGPSRAAWEGSPTLAADHVVGPLLALGSLLGALLWAAAALALPLIVRGRSAARDLLAAVVWSSVLVAFAPALDAGLATGAHAAGRGAVLGAVLGALLALGARALRGPVRPPAA